MASYNELDATLRSDLSLFVRKVFATVSPNDAFKPNWHIEAIAHELTRCHAGENRRLLITQPPRSLKSICASVAFPAWALGHDPTQRFLCVSYSEGLAHEFARQFRMVTESEWYSSVNGRVRTRPKHAARRIGILLTETKLTRCFEGVGRLPHLGRLTITERFWSKCQRTPARDSRLNPTAYGAMTGALGFVAWRSRKVGKVKGLDRGPHAITSRPSKRHMNVRIGRRDGVRSENHRHQLLTIAQSSTARSALSKSTISTETTDQG